MRNLAALSLLALIFVVVWGQLINIFDLVTGFALMNGGELILRIVGLFIPIIGAYFGWF